MSIFDIVTSEAIVGYWEEVSSNKIPYLGEELWPAQQKLGLDIKSIKGHKGLPVVLKPSAFDVKTKKRDRIGIEKQIMQMPFFKESMYIDEEMRQQLNMVMESGNQAYIDSVTRIIFDDEMTLLKGAEAQRERMRMMALTTGSISISANGQDYDYDYGMPSLNKADVETDTARGFGGKPWSDPEASIIDDIRTLQEYIEQTAGTKPSRAVISSKTNGYLRRNKELRQAIRGTDSTAPVRDTDIKNYLLSELGINVVVYSKQFILEDGVTSDKFVPDDTFVMFPQGKLGTGWFGTTPEQSDLMSGTSANVTITDVGVAVTTTKETDPVNVETKVSMIYLPSFETINQVGILSVA